MSFLTRRLHPVWVVGVGVLVLFELGNLHYSSESMEPPFLNSTVAAGIDFVHQRGTSNKKHLVETIGSGCAFLDFDRDGLLDILLVNGGRTPDSPASDPARHRLYRNLGSRRFKDVSDRAGLVGNGSYGIGVAVGDYDNDGYPDIYITNFGPNILYHNNGDGTFTDVTAQAAVGCPDFSSSAAFLDYDNDGLLDLYVANYVDFTYETAPSCDLKGIRTYCHPRHFSGVPNRLYKNLGGGRFRDVSKESGIWNPDGKGLGVVAADFDGDGWIDVYVANDTFRNFLFKNNHDGTFTDVTLPSGTGYNEEGKAEAGMGVDAGDYNGDGLMDIVVTNYDLETNALYRNEGRWLFNDQRGAAGIVRADHFLLGFGIGFFDFDNDGDQDLLVVNGHVLDNIELVQPDLSYAEPLQLLENHGGIFSENVPFANEALKSPRVGRGAAFGDIDNDGDVDVLVNNSGQEPALLMNQVGNRRNWILLKLTGTKSNRDAIGTHVTISTDTGKQTRQIMGGRSYLSSSDPRLHFGLGASTTVKSLKIRWPGGTETALHNIKANQVLSITEDDGNKIAPPNSSSSSVPLRHNNLKAVTRR